MPIDGLPGTIGVITSSLDGDYSRRLIAGAVEVLSANGFPTLCFSPGASGSSEYQIPLGFLDLVDPQHLSGLIFSPPSIQYVDFANQPSEPDAEPSGVPRQYDTERFLQRMGDLPVVCVGAWIARIPSLWVQNGSGIRLLMKHLMEVCGRRRIAFIRGPDKNVEAESRFRAWQDFCIEHSLPHGEELVGLGDFTTPTGEAAALTILDNNSDDLPDAFVVSNDRMAVGVLHALQARGLSVPGDVSVVGFDDLEAESADPPLTTIRQPVFEMGHRAAEVLISLVRAEEVPREHMFNPELIIRESSNPKQGRSMRNLASSGIGACVFLESAYPSAELLMPLLRGPLQDAQKYPPAPFPLGDHLACELERGLQRAKARERDLVASVRSMQARAVEHLAQALAQTNNLHDLHRVVLSYLRIIGLDSLAVALLCDQAKPHTECGLVVDCSLASDAPLSPLGEHRCGSEVIAAQVERTGGLLRVAAPVYHQGEYRGFLLASGMLIDNSLLNQLGIVLTRAAMRILK
jgi:DNA-binding LacI/PurR family transcriptional regulator